LFVCLGPLGCGDDPADKEGGVPEIECPDDVPGFAEVTAFEEVCTQCHDSSLSKEERRNAPAHLNFDDYDTAKANAEPIAAEVYWGKMPPSGVDLALTIEQEDDLLAWALCGTPE
jgi:hypothetical protein